MKVLHILEALNFSGAEMMYVAAAADFQQLGCQLYVVNTAANYGNYVTHFRDAGYTVLHFPCSNSCKSRWHFYCKLRSYIRKEGIDVVHVHRDDLKFISALCAWRCHVKCVSTHHSIYRSNWYSIGYHRFLRWCVTYVFRCRQQSISNSVLLNEKDYYHNNTVLINNWYDNTRFYPAQQGEKELVRKELGIPLEAKVIISVGSCRELKRHKDIIDAISVMKKTDSHICYLHLGDGDLQEEEEEYARQLGVDKQIYFVGNQLDVRKYLIASDIYVMTSRLEGLSLSTIEAMVCGIPAVLYNVPGLKDFNIEQECAVLIEESPDILARTCLDIFANKIGVADLVEKSKHLVQSKFDKSTNARAIYQLYTVC